jgi:hypothetical protein
MKSLTQRKSTTNVLTADLFSISILFCVRSTHIPFGNYFKEPHLTKHETHPEQRKKKSDELENEKLSKI